MPKINYNIRNTEIDALADSIVLQYGSFFASGVSGSSLGADEFLASLVAELERLSALMRGAIHKDAVRSRLGEADAVRDGAIRRLGAALSGYAALPIEEKAAAARALRAVFDKYAKANITSEGYGSESSLVESMLEDFSAPALSAQIGELEGVAGLIALVRAAQDSFAEAEYAFVQAKAKQSACASSFKKPIVALINEKLVPYLDVMVLSGKEGFSDFARTVNAEIKRANERIARRAKKS